MSLVYYSLGTPCIFYRSK